MTTPAQFFEAISSARSEGYQLAVNNLLKMALEANDRGLQLMLKALAEALLEKKP